MGVIPPSITIIIYIIFANLKTETSLEKLEKLLTPWEVMGITCTYTHT